MRITGVRAINESNHLAVQLRSDGDYDEQDSCVQRRSHDMPLWTRGQFWLVFRRITWVIEIPRIRQLESGSGHLLCVFFSFLLIGSGPTPVWVSGFSGSDQAINYLGKIYNKKNLINYFLLWIVKCFNCSNGGLV